MINETKYFENLKEGDRIELKSSTRALPKSIYETYSSFSNTGGGRIFLGIKEGSDKNEIVGVEDPGRLIGDFFNGLNDPKKVSHNTLVSSNVEVVDVEGKKIVVIEIPEAPYYDKPIYLNGNPNLVFLRNHDGDYQADETTINSMMADKSPRRYDDQVNKYAYTIDDLCQDSLTSYAKLYRSLHAVGKELDDRILFTRLGLIRPKEGGGETLYVTNGGVLLFGYENQIRNIFPNYFIDYREKTGDNRFDYRINTDSLSFSGNVFDFLNLVLPRLSLAIPNPFKLEGWVNVGGKELYEAVREGVVNAICNADFLLPGGVVVTRYARTLEIKNPGLLRVSLEQALRGGESNPRNPFVQQVFERVNLCEKAGTGIPAIFSACRNNGLPDPSLSEDRENRKTILTFFLPVTAEEQTVGGEKNVDKILAFLSKKENGATLDEISGLLGLHPKYVSSILSKMNRAGLVSSTRKAKGKRFLLNK